jgi:phosphoglycolate phosphatase-like HAD superfamily hydrolase
MKIGFDLDQTLIDSSTTVDLAFEATCKEFGLDYPRENANARLGTSAAVLFSEWFPDQSTSALLSSFQGNQLELSRIHTQPLVNPRRLSEWCLRLKVKPFVVTAKATDLALQILADLTFDAMEVSGGHLDHESKAKAILNYQATCYVGDSISDIKAAQKADVTPLGVAAGEVVRRHLPDLKMQVNGAIQDLPKPE